MTIETGHVMRHDVVVLDSGTTSAVARDRLEQAPSPEPVVLVRRQGIGTVTWHHVGYEQLRNALDAGATDERLGTLLSLDALTEVAVVALHELVAAEATGIGPPHGVVVLGSEVIGFSEGQHATGELEGPRRGSVPEPPAAPRASATRPSVVTASESADTAEDATTFGAYPLIEAPITVEPEATFNVAIRVDDKKTRHTVSAGITVGDLDPYLQTVTLKVLLTAPAFELVDGSDELPELKIDRASLDHAPVVFHLRTAAEPPSTYDPEIGVWTARLTATFFYEGTIVGEAYREIRVNETRARHVAIESDGTPVDAESTAPPPMTADTDITIAITHEPGAGNFTVRVSSPHLAEPVPGGTISLGEDATSFAAVVIREVESSFADQVSDETLGYIGEKIAAKMPEAVLAALRQVWEAVSGPGVDDADRRIPDVLLVTDEWAIPWELMHVDFDDDKPAFLGAQFNVGRWPYQYRDRLESRPLGVSGLGVMIGHYAEGHRVKPLKRAEEEGQELERHYKASMVDADPATLDQLLAGAFANGFEFEALHFAGHGMSNATDGTYLMYSDGKRMSVFALGGARVARQKNAFVFVNACQVGTAQEMLGEYAGLAATAIDAGFRGFVAPLWSVSDVKAKEVSLGLYAASAHGKAISEYLRGVRAGFVQTETEPAHTTYMAYVFYGHPRLRLGGPEARAG